MKEEKNRTHGKTVKPVVDVAYLTNKDIPLEASGELEVKNENIYIVKNKTLEVIGKIEINENGRVQFLKVNEGEESPFILKRKSSNHYLIEPYPIPCLTPAPQNEVLKENITNSLNRMVISFKLLLLVCLYFLMHFMAAYPFPSLFGIVNICLANIMVIAAWKCFFAHKTAIIEEVKGFFEKYSLPEKDLH